MKRSIVLVLYYIFSLSIWGLETKGNLEINTERTNGTIMGETYRGVLTLVPFSLDSITAKDLDNKFFLDYFYISRVITIKASENNVDAIQIFVDIVITKKFKNKSVKIWSLHDMNIPVTFNVGNISKTDLLIKKFITFDTSLDKVKKWNWKTLVAGLMIMLIGIAIYYAIRHKISQKNTITIDVAKEISISKNRADFEWLYRNRKTLSKCMEGKPKSLQQFEELLRLVEKYQYQPSWRKMDISELIVKKNKLLESYHNGV